MGKPKGQISVDPFQIELNPEVPGPVRQARKERAVRESDLGHPLLLRRCAQEIARQADGHDFGVGSFPVRLIGEGEEAAARSSLEVIIDVDVHKGEEVFDSVLRQRKLIGGHTSASAFHDSTIP